MVWYRICGSIAWVGADVRLDGLCASMVISVVFLGLHLMKCRSGEAVQFLGMHPMGSPDFLVRGCGAYAQSRRSWSSQSPIANRVCVLSLVARVDGLFSGGFSCLKKW
ncbi:unnamed protein product [Brassica oleracea var. botrytis]|uniref:(rape) hypothetical protein n=1 Tax=Brassica napus TaxID=3708 RepID=A0A816S0H6_BRANA|nr:unnamed protein product [Brassica napus]